MKEMLDNYSKEPFSRDKIKQKRKAQKENKPADKSGKTFRFNLTSDDKSVKIKFDIKSQEADKNKIIDILEKLVSDLKEDKIKEFDFK